KLQNHLTAASYEVQRGSSAEGPFITINNSEDLTFTDTGLIPGSTYYYRVRAHSTDTVSSFSNIASAPTLDDNVAPSQPGTPSTHFKTFSTISLTWAESIDNIGIKGYEVFVDNELVGIALTDSYQIVGLEPNTAYAI